MFEFILAVLFVELTPGPNMAYLAALALARGRAAGLFAIIGVTLGLGVHAAVASFGAGELLLLYPWLYEILRWIGVTYLLFLAWEGWQTKEKSPHTADLNTAPGLLILRGFLANVLNPKSVLFFVSVVPTFVGISPGQPDFPFQMAIFGIVYVAIATAVHAAIVMLAAECGGTATKCGSPCTGSRSRVRGWLAILGHKTLSLGSPSPSLANWGRDAPDFSERIRDSLPMIARRVIRSRPARDL